MRGAAMSFTAAACGFVVFLLSVSGVQGWYSWGVTCTPTAICALKGSTVEMSCTYRYPPRENNRDTTVEETFWFTKLKGNVPVDLRTEYSGRMRYSCQEKSCTLRITDLRESDSAVYKFRFTTNQPDRTYTSSPGVTLSVTDLQVKKSGDWLDCFSSCHLPVLPVL
ncbi:sialoadhesin-like [Larimichthys crocea]|uniref:sialoadhesin-like n=1 Tax=Larimichthys crocea TaxID=215358 RepID=UPI000F5EF48A|nr:sialoadhesin-like [Larimichthys crocea]